MTSPKSTTWSLSGLDVQGVFIEIGLYPNTDFVLDLLDANERGEIKVDSADAGFTLGAG